MDYKTMWENLRAFVDEALQQGKDRGFYEAGSAYYGEYSIYEQIDEVMEHNELEYGEEVFEFVVDRLIRHKWPEEKPVVPDEVEFKVYLARYKIDDEFIFMDSVAYYKDTGWGTSGVTHWWELPEVTE